MRIKIFLVLILCTTPLAAKRLDDAIALTEAAQAGMPVLLRASTNLMKSSGKVDELSVSLTSAKQTLAAQQTQLDESKRQLAQARSIVAALTMMPSSISRPLQRSLTKQEELLAKLESMLESAQASVVVVEEKLPTLKGQALGLAKDINDIRKYGGVGALSKIHTDLIGLRNKRERIGKFLRRKS